MWIDTSIRYILWFCFFIAIWLILLPTLRSPMKKFRLRTTRLLKKDTKSNNRLIKATERFLEATLNVHSSLAVFTFYFVLLLISLFSFTGLLVSGRSFSEALACMILAPLLVMGFLYLRLHTMRIKVSYEGKEMVSELLNNYRIYHNNIVEAVDQTVFGLGDKYPLSKKVMARLAIDLKNYRNEKELQQVVDHLNYQIEASWSKLLANLIFIAASKGEDITEGLIDITRDLIDLEEINEKNRQINIEGGLMLKFIIPFTLIGGFIVLTKILGFSFSQYINYQFLNPVGFTMFYYMVIVIIATVLIFLFFSQQKNDY